ncbi:MAG: hypothetical protein P4L99_21645 [Chthoniobacter sp.]|nr:hypothetical protein [Chthoniobacter sp.]
MNAIQLIIIAALAGSLTGLIGYCIFNQNSGAVAGLSFLVFWAGLGITVWLLP